MTIGSSLSSVSCYSCSWRSTRLPSLGTWLLALYYRCLLGYKLDYKEKQVEQGSDAGITYCSTGAECHRMSL